MKPIKIKPIDKLSGAVILPGDKSISHRAVMIGAIAKGTSKVKGLLDCDDCNYTIGAFRQMGIDVTKEGAWTTIRGNGLRGLRKPEDILRVGNSGTSMRLLAGILAGQNFESILAGDSGLSRRPMKRIVSPLCRMGALVTSNNGLPPLGIKGGEIKPIDFKMEVASAQVKSAVLFAGLYTDGLTKVTEIFKSRDHTERMLQYFGADIEVRGLEISVKGNRELSARNFEIPGDISSAAFFMVGAVILKGSKIKINHVSINPTRAGIIDVIKKMGGNIKILNKKDDFEPFADIEVESSDTKGIVIDKDMVPNIIDELPVIFVLAAMSKGKTIIRGADELKVKETDRINSMRENLVKAGAGFDIKGDEIVIEGVAKLKGADFNSFGDHRTCMSMAIAALTAEGDSQIDDIGCVNKSFPEFFGILDGLKK